MAEQSAPAPTINAPFPAPPPFWKHFTTDNISRLEAIIKTQATEDEGGPSKETVKSKEAAKRLRPSELRNLKDIPQELTYLIPPPPPTGDTYDLFSETINLSSTLPFPPSIPRLFSPNPNPTPQLLHLTKSILLNYLELIETLSLSPSASPEKLEDLRHLFINAHYLINSLRPHQARESVVGILEEKVKEGKKEVEELERWERDVEGWLEERRMEGEKFRKMDGREKGVVSEVENGVKQAIGRDDDEETKLLWKLLNEVKNDHEPEDDDMVHG